MSAKTNHDLSIYIPQCKETAASFECRIYMAGPIEVARQICREDCYRDGLCVTINPTDYIYTGGEQAGFVVGLINYPRFPWSPAAILKRACDLAEKLAERCCQQTYTVWTPTQSYFFEVGHLRIW